MAAEKKGSKPVRVPLMLELAEELSLGLRHPDTLLATECGRPFSSSGSLDNRVRKGIIAAGLCVEVKDQNGNAEMKPTRSQHGLRKATAHEMAKSGATVYEIAARLSHADFKSSKPYVDGVDRDALGESGFARVQAARGAGVPRPESRGTPDTISDCKITEILDSWQPVGESNPSFQVENLAS